jgi:hypothetical protein
MRQLLIDYPWSFVFVFRCLTPLDQDSSTTLIHWTGEMERRIS